MNTTFYHRETGRKAVVLSSRIQGRGRTLVVMKEEETFTTLISQTSFYKQYAVKPPEGTTYNQLNKGIQ